MVFAGLMLAVGLVYEIMALNMPRGSLAYPGPGLFPMIIGGFLIATALGCLLQEILPRLRTREPAASPLPDGNAAAAEERNVNKTVQLTALMIGYILALKPLGFPLAICAFLVACDPHLRLPQVASRAGDGGPYQRHLLRIVRPLA